MKHLLSILLVTIFSISMAIGQRWSEKKANRWYEKQTWPVGCNFIPSNAINQLEMW